MKFLVLTLFVSGFALAAPTASKKTLPISKEEKQVKEEKAKAAAVKNEKDCDDKAKKPIEIKEDTISLGSGNTGCTLE